MQKSSPFQNLDAEMGVLSAPFQDNLVMVDLMVVLRPEAFAMRAHQAIYEAQCHLFQTSGGFDVVMLVNYLDARGELKALGGAAYIAELADYLPTAAHARWHAHIVSEVARKRHLAQIGQAISQAVMDDPEEHATVLMQKAHRLLAECESLDTQPGFERIDQDLPERFREYERRAENKGQTSRIATGLIELDRLLGGFQGSDLIIIAARTSMGKTAVGLDLARRMAQRGAKVGFASVEMSRSQILDRLFVSESQIESTKLRSGWLSQADWTRLGQTASRFSDLPFYLTDTVRTLDELTTQARYLALRHGVDILFVDYLQLVRLAKADQTASRHLDIGVISGTLKSLAKEFDIPVVALSQLNRELERRPNKRPQLSDLRESGSIEHDADVVLSLYRDEVYDEASADKGVMEIGVLKQRNGPIGMVRVAYLEETGRLENLAHEEPVRRHLHPVPSATDR